MPGEELTNHFHVIRARVTGSGNLRTRLLSTDETRVQVLTPHVMAATADRNANILANFNADRAQLEIKVTDINEKFVIDKIIVYTKQVAASYPG